MREAHAHLKLTEDDFSTIAKHLSWALAQCGVGQDDIDKVISVVATTHDDVLNL